jgi:hypothetical protein
MKAYTKQEGKCITTCRENPSGRANRTEALLPCFKQEMEMSITFQIHSKLNLKKLHAVFKTDFYMN